MKTAALLIAAVIVILLMPATLISIDAFRLTDQEDEYNVTTAAGVTAYNATLSQELFGDNTALASVSSNLTTDAPIASSYDNQVLNVTGLTADASRRLTITYSRDNLGDYWGMGTVARVWPLMLGFGVLGIVVAGVYNATRRGE